MCCTIFTLSKETEITAFRKQGMRVPDASWHYDGIMLQVLESEVYVGSTLHAVGTREVQGVGINWLRTSTGFCIECSTPLSVQQIRDPVLVAFQHRIWNEQALLLTG